MFVPVYQGSGVKLLGDRSSHHYKDPSERGKEARDGCTCISRIWDKKGPDTRFSTSGIFMNQCLPSPQENRIGSNGIVMDLGKTDS